MVVFSFAAGMPLSLDCITLLDCELFELLADRSGLGETVGYCHLACNDAPVLWVQPHKRLDAEVMAASRQGYPHDDITWRSFDYLDGIAGWSVAGLTHGCAPPLRRRIARFGS